MTTRVGLYGGDVGHGSLSKYITVNHKKRVWAGGEGGGGGGGGD